MTLDLRLVRYFVAVAEEGTVTRAAERLHIAQPSLSAAMRTLEAQLGVALLTRRGRRVELTAQGERLARLGRELLEHADAVEGALREKAGELSGSLRLGLSPTARHGVGPQLLAACAAEAPGIMLYTSEGTTGALLRDLAAGRLDLAVSFCAEEPAPGVSLHSLREEPAVVHLPAGHPLAHRERLALADLAQETVLLAASTDSSGYTRRVRAALEQAGVQPDTRPDPHPDLGTRAVHEGLGVVLYVRGAFPPQMPRSAFVPLDPPLTFPFHLATRTGTLSPIVREVVRLAGAAPQG